MRTLGGITVGECLTKESRIQLQKQPTAKFMAHVVWSVISHK